MSLRQSHLFRRGLLRAACIGGIVSVAALVSITPAAAASPSYFPVEQSPVTVGDQPKSVVYDPNPNSITNHPSMFVANFGDGTVSMIDATTRTVLKTITIHPLRIGVRNPGPTGLAVDAASDRVYVANSADGSVSILDGATGTELEASAIDIGSGSEPTALTWDSDLDLIYVTAHAKDQVIAISGVTGLVVRSIAVDAGPTALGYDPSTKQLFVAAQDSNDLDVIQSGATSSSAIPALSLHAPVAIGIDSFENQALIFVANADSNTVTVVDSGGDVELAFSPVPVGDGPDAIAVDHADNTVFVANYSSKTVSYFADLSFPRASSSFSVGNQPSSVAVDANLHTIWTTNESDGTVSVVQQAVSPTITSDPPTRATVGTIYAFPFSAMGAPSQISYTTTGVLPPGIRLVDGSLVGTPTQTGHFAFTLHASNGVDPEATADYVLSVDAAAVTPTPTPTPTTTPTPSPSTVPPVVPPVVPPGGHLPTVAG